MNTSPKRLRLWDATRQRMVPQTDFLALHYDEHGDIGGVETSTGIVVDLRDDLYSEPEGVLMCYTGQEDTEGQPVYEKDVLLVKGNRYVVEFDVESGGYTLEGPGTYPLLPEIIQMGDGAVVIGNTFENPDLIE